MQASTKKLQLEVPLITHQALYDFAWRAHRRPGEVLNAAILEYLSARGTPGYYQEAVRAQISALDAQAASLASQTETQKELNVIAARQQLLARKRACIEARLTECPAFQGPIGENTRATMLQAHLEGPQAWSNASWLTEINWGRRMGRLRPFLTMRDLFPAEAFPEGVPEVEVDPQLQSPYAEEHARLMEETGGRERLDEEGRIVFW